MDLIKNDQLAEAENGKLLFNLIKVFTHFLSGKTKTDLKVIINYAFSYTDFFSSKHEWTWDEKLSTSTSIKLSNNNLNVTFHPVYSTGTAVVRGNRPLERGRHHFWEISMITHIYGTDVVSSLTSCSLNLYLSTIDLFNMK